MRIRVAFKRLERKENMGGICVLIYKSREKTVESDAIVAMLDPVAPREKSATHGETATKVSQVWKNVAVGAYDPMGSDMRRWFFEDDRILVVCDAELYSRRDHVEGKSNDFSEANLIAALYHRHGELWWRAVHGVWSAFIWDKEQGKGFVFRDRLGVKPIVYAENSESIVIASRIKSISSRSGFRKEIDSQAIFSYLNMEMIPSPFTIFKGITKLESGFVLEISSQSGAPLKTSTKMVWNMSFPPDKLKSEEEMKEKIRSLLKDSVRMQGEYREPISEVGAFLSGGTDSSSITGLFEESFPGQTKTFSMGFDENGFDEMHYCRVASKAFHTKQHEYYVTPDDILNALPTIIDAYDEPFANSSAIPSYFCAKLGRENGMRVLLGGDGGDEIFGGNSRYRDMLNGFKRFPGWLQNGIMAPALSITPSFLKIGPVRPLDRYIRRAMAPLHEKIHAYGLDYYVDYKDVFEPDFLKPGLLTPADISRRYLERSDADNDIDRYMHHDLKVTLMDNDLPKINTMTELAGIRVRYPFLDSALVEMTGHLPAHMKVKGDRLRYIFKEAMRGLLPDEIIEKTKHGFGIPVARWMVRPGKLNDLVRDVLFDPRTSGRGFFRKSFIENIYKLSGNDKSTFYGTYLYYVFFLEMWMRKHADF